MSTQRPIARRARRSPLGALSLASLASLATAAACWDPPPPSESPPGEPSKITVSTRHAPMLIAFRDGLDADWQTPKASADGTYELEVHGPYVVTVVCDEGSVTTRQIARTPEDARTLDMECPVWGGAQHLLTGKMVQPGSIGYGDAWSSSPEPDWTFAFTADGAPHDLLALTSDRIAIRRDLAAAADTQIPDVDVAQEGVALERATFTVANQATGEHVRADVRLATMTTYSTGVSGGPLGVVTIVPSSILKATDRQTVQIVGSTLDTWRYVERPHRTGDPTSFTLPDPIGGAKLRVANGALTAGWSTLPAHDALRLQANGYTSYGTYRSHDLELSARFMTATGTTEAALDTQIPDYRPEWRMDLSRDHGATLFTVHRVDGEDRGSGFRMAVGSALHEGPAADRRPWVNARPSRHERRRDRR